MYRMYWGLQILFHLCGLGHGNTVQSVFESSEKALELLEPKSTCMKDVVKWLLPECQTGSLDVQQRVECAVRLSICEFDASDVKYPSVCQKENTTRCTQALETRTQWWTTYSGYYKSIGQICSEYQQEHEMENIVQLYQKVNSVESQLYFHLANALTKLDLELAYTNETKLYFEEIVRQFETINALSKDTLATYNRFMDQSLDRFTALEHVYNEIVEKTQLVVETVSVVTKDLQRPLNWLSRAKPRPSASASEYEPVANIKPMRFAY